MAVDLVGPKGYEHNWHFVGVPGGSKAAGHITAAQKALSEGRHADAVNHLTAAQMATTDKKLSRSIGAARNDLASRIMHGKPAGPRSGSTLDAYKGWRDGLTPAESKAMSFYQSPGFALMNGQLRGLDAGKLKAGEHASDADLARARQASKGLVKAIAKAPPLPRDTTVYRGFDAGQFGALTPGKVITDKGFTSVSVNNDAGAVGRAASKAQATITLPKGTRAAAGSVRELVLPPGSSFRVTSVAKRGGVTHVGLDLVPKGGAKLASHASAVELSARTRRTAVKTPAPERAAGRRKLAGKQQALPDGSFIVPDVDYLKKAIRSVGRAPASKRPALGALIRKRARELKATNTPGVKGTWAFQGANDGGKVIEMAAARMPKVRGAADVQMRRAGPGTITVQHKSTGMKVGTLAAKGRGWQGTHASGVKTPASGSQQGALAGLIAVHNRLAAGSKSPMAMPPAQQMGSAVAASSDAGKAVDLAGSLPVTSAASSSDGPRVTSMGSGKPAASGGPAGLSPYAQSVYKKLIAKGMKPAQAEALARRAAAMHDKAAKAA